MMTHKEAIAFAVSSAREALDNPEDYEDSYGTHHDNVMDTFRDEKVDAETYREGMAAFEAECKRIGLVPATYY